MNNIAAPLSSPIYVTANTLLFWRQLAGSSPSQLISAIDAQLAASQGAELNDWAQGWRDGIDAAARVLTKKAESFAEDHGHSDLGVLSFGSGSRAEAKLEYHNGLIELAEELALSKSLIATGHKALQDAIEDNLEIVHPGKHAELPVLLNGLTAEETATTASCLGLIARPAGAQQPGACGNTPYDEGPFTLEQRSVTAGVTGPRDVVSIQRQAFIRGWDERGMMHQLSGTVETDEHMRALLDIYFPRTAAPTIQPAPASQRGALEAFENKERGTPQAHIAAAVVESGYSGDPDTKGTLIVRALDLSECKVGDYLYAASTRPAPNDAPDNCKIQDTNQQSWDAELGRTAMQFVDRAGDVHPGIDDAETICAEFYKAMMAVIERMPHVQRMSKP